MDQKGPATHDQKDPKSASKPAEKLKTDPLKDLKASNPELFSDQNAPEYALTRMLNTNDAPDDMPKKRKRGRPTKYKAVYCQQIIAYFNREHTYQSETIHTNTKGDTWTAYHTKANPVPLMCAFAHYLDVGTTTLERWEQEHSEFRAATTRAQELQLEHLAAVTGMGLYNSNWAVFMAKNISKWRDKKELEHSGKVDSSIFVNQMAGKAAEAEAAENRIAGHSLN